MLMKIENELGELNFIQLAQTLKLTNQDWGILVVVGCAQSFYAHKIHNSYYYIFR